MLFKERLRLMPFENIKRRYPVEMQIFKCESVMATHSEGSEKREKKHL